MKELNPKEDIVAVVTRRKVPKGTVLIRGDVADPQDTLARLCALGVSEDEILVSVWFIFHEVLGKPGIELAALLKDYRALAPEHGLLIGEIFDLPEQVLAEHHPWTAVPEFNLFHELSGQKLLSLPAWESAIEASGYSVCSFIGLDPLGELPHYGSGIWYLQG